MTTPPTPKRFSGRTYTTATQPPQPTSGDFWLNPTAGSLKFWDGTQWVAVGGGTGEQQTGLSSGGILSVGTDTAKFDITAGTGLVVDNYTTPGTPTVTEVSWSAFDEVTVTDLATQPRTYIAIDSTGAIVQQGGPWTIEERRDLIVIGLLVHPNGTSIQATGGFVITTWDLPLQLVDFVQAVGPMNVTGNVVSSNGANLNIDRSAGSQYRLGGNYDTSAQNPSVVTSSGATALTFRYRYRDGSGGYTEGADATAIDPANYDDNSGTPATVSGADKWTVQRFWCFASGIVRIMYGQNKYKNLAEAEASLFGAVFDADANLLSNGVLRGWLILKNDATDLSDTTKAKFIEADQFGSTPSGGVSSATTTLQQAYANSDVEPEIVVDSGGGAVSIQDAASPIGANLLEVQDNGGSADFFAVDVDGIIVDGTLRLKERAASLADVATFGQLWVLTATPNQLWYTDDAGNDSRLGDLLADGTVPLTANWDAGNFQVRALTLRSDTALAAPLIVASTTKVDNLNADLLDGQTALDFLHSDGDNALAGTLSIIEQAAADADVATEGQVWVKTATPNELWYTDDAGNDIYIGRKDVLRVEFNANPWSTNQLTNMAAAKSFWNVSAGHRMAKPVNLVGYTHVRLLVWVATAGSAGSKVVATWYDTGNYSAIGSWGAVGTSAVECAIDVGRGPVQTAFIPLAAGPIADGVDAVVLPVTEGGDGAADPRVSGVAMEFI